MISYFSDLVCISEDGDNTDPVKVFLNPGIE
jgi:hypothetical protein